MIFEPERLAYKTADVVKYACLNKETIYNLVDEGILTPINNGKGYIFLREDLEHCLKWLQGLTISSTKESIKLAKLKKPFKK